MEEESQPKKLREKKSEKKIPYRDIIDFFCTKCARPFGRLADAKGLSVSSVVVSVKHLFLGAPFSRVEDEFTTSTSLFWCPSSIIQMIGVVAFAKAREGGGSKAVDDARRSSVDSVARGRENERTAF